MSLTSAFDTIYQGRGFKVTFGIFVGAATGVKLAKYGGKGQFSSHYHDRYDKDKINVQFNTFRNRILTVSTAGWNEETRSPTQGPKYVMTTRNFYEFRGMLAMGVDWLKSPDYTHLFSKDNKGNVVGLGTVPPYLPTVAKINNEILNIAPAIIKAEGGALLEGISIFTNRGPLITLPYADYLNLAYILMNFIDNVYANTHVLFQSSMIYNQGMK